MADLYQRFLSSPSASALAPNAALHYITTTTSIHEPAAIVKHLQAQEKLLKKKNEKILSAVEGNNAICLETETTYEFLRGGGAILPQLDDNMLADTVAVCPMVHVVSLENGKISQIRLHWDQATMLRQVEAIGKTGRNWPIRDGNAQTKLVASSVAAIGREASARDSRSSNGSRGFDEPMTHRAKSSQSRGRDAHDLFTHPDEERQPSEGPSVATRNSVKPPVRQLDELVGEPSESRGIRSPSPSKQEGTVLKAGAGKNFNPSRLFDPNEPDDRSQSPERRKAMPNKYNHFEFANSEDGDSRPPSGKTKNQMTTHWDFDDFTTPEKVQPKPQREQERHIGFGIDEDDPKSPPKRPIVHAARPDVESHFNMSDKSSPVPSQRPSSKGGRPGVFSNHVTQGASDPEPLANITSTTNIDNSRRREDSEPHWSMSTPVPEKKIYKTAGNGMGGRKENSLHWSLGGDNDEPEQKIYKTSGNGMGGRSSTARSWAIGDDFDAEDAAADRRKTEASKSRRGFERSGF